MLLWIKRVAAGRPYIWQQDSLLCHTSRIILPRGCQDFCNPIIPNIWLPNYKDCHPFDYYVWGAAEGRIRDELCLVGWGYKIHQLLLCWKVRPTPNKCPGYDTKQSDGEVPVVLELWRMRSTPLLPLLPGPLWPGVVAPGKGPIYGLNRTKLCFLHNTNFYN